MEEANRRYLKNTADIGTIELYISNIISILKVLRK